MSKTITISSADYFEIKGNADVEAATASLEGKKKVSILDAYKAVDRSVWLGIVSACFNDKTATPENKSARYWRAPTRKWARISGIPSVVDYLFAEGKVSSLDTLAKTYCPDLYNKVRGK